jgi:hypothetical protein
MDKQQNRIQQHISPPAGGSMIADTAIPGQATLPTLETELGYGAITYLTPRHERFCWEFVLKNGSATDAYTAAYPNTGEASAKANSARLLKTEKIQKRLSEIKTELQRKYAVSAGSLVLYLSQVLHLDRRQFLDKSGQPKAAHQLDTEASKILDLDFTLDRSGNQKAIYSIPTRIQAAQELARLFGLNKDRIEITGEGCNPEHTLTTIIHGGNIRDNDQDIDVRGIEVIFVTPGDDNDENSNTVVTPGDDNDENSNTEGV